MRVPHIWSRLFACPRWDNSDDDLGAGVFNPVYSNLDNMIKDGAEGCQGCDLQDECNGPIEYAPVHPNEDAVPDGDALQRGS